MASTRRWIPLLLPALMISFLAGCGGSGTTNLQNPPAPASSSVSIAFQPAPVAAIALNTTTSLTAVVTNDPANAGVDWSLLCSTGVNTCGSLSLSSAPTASGPPALHTASGAPVFFNPPAAISGNSQTFTIEAFATADHTKNLLAPITVTGFGGNLKGTYVFQTRGVNSNPNTGATGPFQLTGVIVLDGNGNVTSGEQTRNGELATIANPNAGITSVSDAISGGSYTIGPDGRGTITLNTADQNIGQLGVENFSLIFLSNAQALIATVDNVLLPALSGEISSGTMDLQTSTAAPLQGYAFAVTGIDIANLAPMAIGGILNINSPGTISGAGSVTDQDDSITGFFPNSTVSGTVSGPDPLGSVTFLLTTSFASSPIQFTGYIIDATHMKLIESDNTSGIGFGSTAGQAIGQGAATGTFSTNSSFAGNFVFNVLGQDFSGLTTSLASVGQFTAGGGTYSGYDDELASGFGTLIGDSFTGTYTPDPTGAGRFDSNITFATGGTPGPELIFYLTGNGNPPLILDADPNFFALGVGAAYPQAAPPLSFNGKYGSYLVQTTNNGAIENDGAAVLTVGGASMTYSGTLDSSSLGGVIQTGQALTGTFGAIPSAGRFTGNMTNTAFNFQTLAMDFFLIDSAHGFYFETDFPTTSDLTFGYFAARTPVCPTCQ